MNEDAVPPNDAPTGSAEPVRPYDIRAVRLTIGGIGLAFLFWTMGSIYLLDRDIYAHVADSHGTWPLIVLLGGLALALAGEVYSDLLTLKSWLERGIFAAALLLFAVFAAAIGINVADKQLSSDYKGVLGGGAFCCGSLTMTALVWWISLSPTNPLRMREVQRKSTYIGDAIRSRGLDEMTGRGILLLVATALLAVPPLAALTLIAFDWQDESKVVFSYPAGVLTLFGAFILLCVVGVRAWQRGRRHDAASRDIPAGSN
jgi:hypothetical protein